MLRALDRQERPVRREEPSLVAQGMRRVRWVRIVVDDGVTTCEVFGIGHRLPVSRRVSLETALDLAACGVPMVTRIPGGSLRGDQGGG